MHHAAAKKQSKKGRHDLRTLPSKHKQKKKGWVKIQIQHQRREKQCRQIVY